MTTGTIHERFASGDANTRTIHVGPGSKLLAGVSDIGTVGTGFTAVLEFFALGGWQPLSDTLNGAGFVTFSNDFTGNIPAGTEVRMRVTGTYTDVDLFIITS